jgi:group I intron endonuclease
MEIVKGLNTTGIYCIRNTIDDRCYIGSALKLCYRLWNHKHLLIKKKHHCKYLQNFVNKYGIDVLYIEILEKDIPKETLISREQYYIDSLLPEFNTLKVAGSSLGTVMTQEQKDKISKNRKGIGHTEDTKKRISETMKGVPKPKEHAAKVGLAHRGKKISEEQKKLISENNKGRRTTAKLTWDIVNEIRELNKQGIKDKEIASRYNISNVQACYIRNFKCWIPDGMYI